DPDRASRGRELARVREQIHENLREPLTVAGERRQSIEARDLEALAALLEQRTHELDGGRYDVGEDDVLAPDRELSRLDAYALEQIVDQPCEPLCTALERHDELPLLGRGHRAEAVAQKLDRRELRRERRAELVRDIREHRVA